MICLEYKQVTELPEKSFVARRLKAASGTANLLKQVKAALPNVFQHVFCTKRRFQSAGLRIASLFG